MFFGFCLSLSWLHNKYFKVSCFKIAFMAIRSNPPVTQQENKLSVYARDFFFKDLLHLHRNCCLLDQSGSVWIWNLHNIVPKYLLQLAERISTKYIERLKYITDCRDNHESARLGSYIERGRSGTVWTCKELLKLEGFLTDIDEIGRFVSDIFSICFPDIAKQLARVPTSVKLWDSISLMFWNATNISKDHTDPWDYTWSMVMPFRHFTGGNIDLRYLNTTV